MNTINKEQPSSLKILWLTVFFAVLIWSGIHPKNYFTWLLEVAPALIGLVILATTYHKFTWSRLTYFLILLHCLVLMVGGHYTYAEVPLFDTIANWFNWERNHYDKLGHFVQGFVPACIARELLLRLNVVKNERWLLVFVVSVCLAFSAFYELVEWWVAIAVGEDAEAFLGTQGYVWDTQSDMFMALIGSAVFLVFFRKWQDTSIRRLAIKPT
jgi:putative membrane protein